MKMRFASIAKLVCILAACLAVAACGSSGKKKQKFAYVERPVELLYANATRELERKRYDTAIAYFEEVERQHPYSAWARRAMLMKAFSYYQGNDYDEAVTAIDQFISLHPGNKDAGYAYYLKAMCYYERIRDVGRDQEFTNDAVAALNDVVRRYPDTEYARDARLKLDLTNDHLAGKEMYVGRYYLKANKHIAAINRFKKVITDYQTTSHVPEALHRLVEAYLELGIVDEARAAAAVLGYNYPGSQWYQDSYKLFESRGILAEGSESKRAKPEKLETPAPSLEDVNPNSLRAIEPPSPSELEALEPPNNAPETRF
ncbi:MAG: outer membrane protein assembly factor BamD [Hyphococcus sp.]|nr:MAG: outer membrane protein assembly factor BamD [Marinicaulis sp.]